VLARRFAVLADLAAARAERVAGSTAGDAVARAKLRREAFAFRCTARRVASIPLHRARSWLLAFLAEQARDPVTGPAYRRMREDLALTLGEPPRT
jgi:hypothetical protein